MRHASRFALPDGTDLERWLLSDGHDPEPDFDRGIRRARAAIQLLLALPGSVYLYQGEELGLFEVADLRPVVLQDPIWVRDGGARKGRDGCRVPIPWQSTGPSFGFGSGGSHLPMPSWFADHAVAVLDGAAGSTLEFYRRALSIRRRHQTAEDMQWLEGGADTLWFSRPGGWNSLTNFGSTPVDLPEGNVLLASSELADGQVPSDTTVWYLV